MATLDARAKTPGRRSSLRPHKAVDFVRVVQGLTKDHMSDEYYVDEDDTQEEEDLGDNAEEDGEGTALRSTERGATGWTTVTRGDSWQRGCDGIREFHPPIWACSPR